MANPFRKSRPALSPSTEVARVDLHATGILSPWADPNAQLGSVMIAEGLYGAAKYKPLEITDALQVPAVARAYQLLVSSLAALPLVALDKDGKLAEQPTFLYRSDTGTSPYDRLAATIRSLYFYGSALWAVQRGAAGQIIDAAWVPDSQWDTKDGAIRIRTELGTFQPISNPRAVIMFEHPLGGILNVAHRTLRSALMIEADIERKVRNPIPLTALRNDRSVDEGELAPAEIRKLLDTWSKERNSPDGALGYLPQGIKLEVFGTTDPALWVEARNQVRIDIANFSGIPTSLLDGSLSESTLTYTTTEGNRSRFIDETVPLWLDPITMRLSADDVVPRGQRVRADLTERLSPTPNPTGAPVED